MDFNGKCIENPSATNFLSSCPATHKYLRKLSKFYEIFVAVQLRTFCSSIQDFVRFLEDWGIFYELFAALCTFLWFYSKTYNSVQITGLTSWLIISQVVRYSPEVVTGGSHRRKSPEVVTIGSWLHLILSFLLNTVLNVKIP